MHHIGVTNSVANSIVDSLAHLCLVLFYGWVVWTAARGFPGIIGTVLSYGPIVYLGKISYGLYVFHLLTVPFLPPVMRLLHVPSSLENNLPLRVAILAALTLGLSMLSWHVFEKPLNDLKRYFPYDSNQTAGRVATVTSANGYDSPLPDEILPLASAKVPPTR